jgi:NADH:ubiquinone oxidoreductase subunit 2 (subunit N)
MTLVDLGTAGGLALAMLPEIVLSAWALLVMLIIAWRHHDDRDQRLVGVLALVGLVVTLVVVAAFARPGSRG